MIGVDEMDVQLWVAFAHNSKLGCYYYLLLFYLYFGWLVDVSCMHVVHILGTFS